MKRKVTVHFLVSMLVACALMWVIPVGTKAYTEEEKAAVKAWLSAHGYSPTMSGAEQAYADYLNGMWGGPPKTDDQNSKDPNAEATNPDTGQNDGNSDGGEAVVSADQNQGGGDSGETVTTESNQEKSTKQENVGLSPESQKVMNTLFEDISETEEEAKVEKVLKSDYDELEKLVEEKDKQIEEKDKQIEELIAKQDELIQEKEQQSQERLKAEEEVQKNRELVAKRKKQVAIGGAVVLAVGFAVSFVFIRKRK